MSKTITLLESTKVEHNTKARKVLELVLANTGNSLRIGITGVPGVGKSTTIEALGTYLIEEKNKSVAVLAIDPSSKKTGGSILGDKTRMNNLSINEKAFIRPSPSSGTLGGVAKATRETMILCEAAGFDTILVETVGVGQSEIEVKSMVDFFLLLMLAGAGDELQGIKRGIMEIADGIFINKADGNNITKAKLAISKGREDLAKAALVEKQTIGEEVAAVEEELGGLDDHIAQLNDEVAQLQQKLSDAKAKRKAMEMRTKTVENRLKVKRQIQREAVDDAFAKFERFERRMDNLEGQVEAMDLGGESRTDLASEINSLVDDDKINDELTRLKAEVSGSNENSGQ